MSVSNCSSSHGNTQAGDQNGNEYYVCDWYRYSNGGWNYYLIYEGTKADEVNKLAAQYARAAANNNCIGYSQSDRYSMWEHLKTSNYDPAQITIKCNADCSSSTTFIFKAVGYKLGIDALKNLNTGIYTGNMKSAFVNAGFKAYSDSKYLTSADYIKAGGVLLNEVHHVVINLDNGSKVSGSTSGRVDIAYGSRGDTVKEAQTALNKLGFRDENGDALEVDGNFGKHTDYAVKAFQSKYDLGPDGKMSATGITWAKIDELLAKKTSHATLRKGSRGSEVTLLQQTLINKGYSCGSYGADGVFGSSTDSAVRKFQRANGLSVDGIVGKNTWAALGV